jgi:hypothetical protein
MKCSRSVQSLEIYGDYYSVSQQTYTAVDSRLSVVDLPAMRLFKLT